MQIHPRDDSFRPLKIALVCDHFLPRIGGIEIHVRNLATQLIRRGHRVQVLTAYPGESPWEGIDTRRIKTPLIPGSHAAFFPGFLRKVRRLLQQEAFDVLHCHSSIFSPLAYGTAVMGIQMRIPVVLTNHSLFSVGSITAFRTARLFCRLKKTPVVFSSVSCAGAERLRKAIGGGEVRVLPNGVSTDYWDRPKIPHEGLQVVSVGRLHRKKNPLALIQTISEVVAEVDGPIRLTMIGDGSLRKQGERLAQRLGVASRVEWKGNLTHHQMRQSLLASDVFALPSSWETMPISLLEAGAAGLPVVAMKRGGVPDIIRHGSNGLMAENLQEFSGCLIKLLRDPAYRDQMSRKAKERAKTFSWEKILGLNLQIYGLAQSKLKTKESHEKREESLLHRGYGT